MTAARRITDTATPHWQEGIGDRPWRVTVFEHAARNRTLYLKWRAGGNWAYESLQIDLYDEKGKRLPAAKLRAVQQAARDRRDEKYAELRSGAPPKAKAPLTLAETWEVVSHADTGLYPVDTAHRREVKRELEHACRILGATTPWNAIDDDSFVRLSRRRIRELHEAENRGLRGAEVTIGRLLAVERWLRDRKRISLAAAVIDSRWKDRLRADWRRLTGAHREYVKHQPRYTVDESRALLRVAHRVDPRLDLLLSLGAELRLGQVARARRSDLKLDHGVFDCPGWGKKKGPRVLLTEGQLSSVRDALDPIRGYLRDLEASTVITDYPLFPQGQLAGGRALRKPPRYAEGTPASWRAPEHPVARIPDDGRLAAITSGTWQSWLRKAEALAKITHVDGRLGYGIRRVAVDFGKASGISREGLQAHGGWSSTQIPDREYADQQMEYAREEAKGMRAKFRGER